jgi:P2-related tail formation protein
VWLALACFASYLDPEITPEDMLAWLADWVGVVVGDNWHPEQLRRLIARAAKLYRSRGTVLGIADLVEAYTGLRPEVSDGGTVTVSRTPDSAPGGSADAVVLVRVRGATLDMEALQRLRRLLVAAIPAHMTIRLEAI